MPNKEAEQQQAIVLLCTDMPVPKDHLLRKIDAAVGFTHIYDLVKDLYCENNGRPSCDLVVLFKLVLIQYLFGIRSLRQTMRDVEVNVAYRWFLGYTMSQPLPNFATISYAFRHRFAAVKFAALNLKKFAIRKWLRLLFSSLLCIFEATSHCREVASLTN